MVRECHRALRCWCWSRKERQSFIHKEAANETQDKSSHWCRSLAAVIAGIPYATPIVVSTQDGAYAAGGHNRLSSRRALCILRQARNVVGIEVESECSLDDRFEVCDFLVCHPLEVRLALIGG